MRAIPFGRKHIVCSISVKQKSFLPYKSLIGFVENNLEKKQMFFKKINEKYLEEIIDLIVR